MAKMSASFNKFPHVLWLFTQSDQSTFILPNVIFGVVGALSGCLASEPSSSVLVALWRLLLVLLFNWTNVSLHPARKS